jgi:hypothetical protein
MRKFVFMKHILSLTLFIFVSHISFSQKQDTINLFEGSKKQKRKDVNKELQSHPPSKLDSVYYIKYGTSAGECTGYCFHEAIVDSINMIRVQKSLQADKKYPIKIDTVQIKSDQWDMLINSIEISSFFSIPEKIGNPGIGETEWIEINYIGKIHKVTFDSTGPDEYEGIKNLEKLLKNITEF